MRIGFIGLGTMGSRMVANLQKAGHELIDRVTEAHMANEARLLEGLSAAERERLAGLLRKLGLSLPPLLP